MAHPTELVDELANELATWPGVRIALRGPGDALVLFREHELGVLHRERGEAEIRFVRGEAQELIEHGDAEPDDPARGREWVTHSVEGPSDVTATLELFDRRYRELRGEDEPYRSEDPATPDGER
jgi:hypothetical protein